MYFLVPSQRATAHTLQNVSEVDRERSRLAAASSVCDSTKQVLTLLASWFPQITVDDTKVFTYCFTTHSKCPVHGLP